MLPCIGISLRDYPGGRVGDAQIERFAGGYEMVERLH